jgi:hypothetical protein
MILGDAGARARAEATLGTKNNNIHAGIQTGSVGAGLSGGYQLGRDSKGVGQITLNGDAKGVLGAGGNVGGTVTLKNPYSKEFRSKSMDAIKKDLRSGDPNKIARGLNKVLKDNSP